MLELKVEAMLESGVTNDHPNKGAIKNQLICDYIDIFYSLYDSKALIKSCKNYLSGWNNILKAPSGSTTAEYMATELAKQNEYLTTVIPPLPLEWYMETPTRKAELKNLGTIWIERHTEHITDGYATEACN